jgi:hypothetical protein
MNLMQTKRVEQGKTACNSGKKKKKKKRGATACKLGPLD